MGVLTLVKKARSLLSKEKNSSWKSAQLELNLKKSHEIIQF
jgi:hypothetical protein